MRCISPDDSVSHLAGFVVRGSGVVLRRFPRLTSPRRAPILLSSWPTTWGLAISGVTEVRFERLISTGWPARGCSSPSFITVEVEPTRASLISGLYWGAGGERTSARCDHRRGLAFSGSAPRSDRVSGTSTGAGRSRFRSLVWISERRVQLLPRQQIFPAPITRTSTFHRKASTRPTPSPITRSISFPPQGKRFAGPAVLSLSPV